MNLKKLIMIMVESPKQRGNLKRRNDDTTTNSAAEPGATQGTAGYTRFQSGHLFTPDSHGIASELTRLLTRYGIQNDQTHPLTLEYHAGTTEGHHFAENMRLAFRTAVPFLRKWSRVPEDYEATYHQMLDELQQLDFVVIWRWLTAWGTKLPK